MNVEEVSQLKKSLDKNLQEENTVAAIDILKKLKNEVVVTKSLLKKTEVGVFINKQRSHPNTSIANLAKEIVKKWKTDVQVDDKKRTPPSNGTSETSSARNTPPSNSVTPSPSPKASAKASPAKVIQRTASQSSIHTPATPSPETPSSENGGERSLSSDNVKLISTGDSGRDKIIELLYNSLVLDSSVDSEIILSRATRIEEEVLKQFKTPEKDYRNKIRGLITNLKDRKNPTLRQRVVNGEIPVPTFCTMSKEEMASEERRARDREIQQQNLFKARGASTQAAETDMFRCGKCGKRKTTYYQMQTRSADEPMTTFVTCCHCQNRWKFC